MYLSLQKTNIKTKLQKKHLEALFIPVQDKFPFFLSLGPLGFQPFETEAHLNIWKLKWCYSLATQSLFLELEIYPSQPYSHIYLTYFILPFIPNLYKYFCIYLNSTALV